VREGGLDSVNRMLKKALNFVLARPKSSRTPEGTLRYSPSLRPCSTTFLSILL
jgi:hypothetical protein